MFKICKNIMLILFLFFAISSIILLTVNVIRTDAQDNNFKEDYSKHKNWRLLDATTCGRRAGDFEKERVLSDSSDSVDRRILGGANSNKRELPWIVQPQRISRYPGEDSEDKSICGGTVINKRYVVTAAHCCQPDPEAVKSEFFVKLNGDTNSTDIPIPVEQITIHDQPDNVSVVPVHDICLLRLQTPIKFSSVVQPICLPPTSDWPSKNLTGLNLTIAGWGVTGPDVYTQSELLQKVNVNVTDTNECANQYRVFDPPVMVHPQYHLCVGNMEKDACVGDSGGPAIYKSVQGTPKYYLLGNIYFGVSCGISSEDRGEPGLYMRVSNYVPWILDSIYE